MKFRCDGNIVFFVVAESLCGATVTLFDLLRLNDTVLKVYFTLRRSLFMRGLMLQPYLYD